MENGARAAGFSSYHLIAVHPGPPGKYTARVLSFPDIQAVADTEEQAIDQAQQILTEWLATARLVQVRVAAPRVDHSKVDQIPQGGTADPMEQAYLEELTRFRREDLERTLREEAQTCSNTSSTPTT